MNEERSASDYFEFTSEFALSKGEFPGEER